MEIMESRYLDLKPRDLYNERYNQALPLNSHQKNAEISLWVQKLLAEIKKYVARYSNLCNCIQLVFWQLLLKI